MLRPPLAKPGWSFWFSESVPNGVRRYFAGLIVKRYASRRSDIRPAYADPLSFRDLDRGRPVARAGFFPIKSFSGAGGGRSR